MSEQLVTVATFGTPMEASIARNQLEAEGVKAVLADDPTVGVNWILGASIGGVKLQVAEGDHKLAVTILESHDGVEITESDWASDEPNEMDDDDVEEYSDEDESNEEEEPKSVIDDLVDRAFRAAVIGLIFLPIQLYSIWLIIRVAFDMAPLSPRNRRRLLLALLLDVPVLILFGLFMRALIAGE